MAYGLSQSGLSAGLGLKVVGSFVGKPDLTAIMMPIVVVVTPVKSRSIHGTICLNQLLFDEIAAIELCIAKLST